MSVGLCAGKTEGDYEQDEPDLDALAHVSVVPAGTRTRTTPR